jgi:DNA-binding MarR family transcriptional regulator/5-hydroxyisourate hydrolase-like protein (transthyretin family)
MAVLVLVPLLTVLILGSLSALAGSVTVHGTVLDADTGEPIVGADVTITDVDNGTVLASTVTDENGRYSMNGGFYEDLRLTVEAEGFKTRTKDFHVEASFEPQEVQVDATMSSVGGPIIPPPTSEPTPPHLLYAAVIAIIVIASMVMYSKIKREDLLRHAVRKRIHEYVTENPGAHYRGILDDLELSMGVLTYHLNRLEKAEYLKSRQDGMYRRFYVTGRRTEARFFLSHIQLSIVTTIRENQGISQSKIAERINVTRKVVNYHVSILDQAGLIHVEASGRETACFVVDRSAGAA